MKKLSFVFFSFLVLSMTAQVDKIQIGDAQTYSTAIFQMDATDRGFLIPRMSTIQRDAISLPVRSMLVYDLTTQSFWIYSSSNWRELYTSENTVPFKLVDSDGDSYIHAFGFNNIDRFQFNIKDQEKIDLTSDLFKMEDGNDFLIGTSMDGLGKKFFYDEGMNALRIGTVTGDQWDNENLGLSSFAVGVDNTVSERYSGSWGEGNTVTDFYSVSFGKNNLVPGGTSIAWGINNELNLNSSCVAWGNGNQSSHMAWGSLNESTSSGSVWGIGNSATHFQATAFGFTTAASTVKSTAWGELNAADGEYSTSFGYFTNALKYAETAMGTYPTIVSAGGSGKYSPRGSDRVFVIGNGTSLTNRSNAMEILKLGRTRFWGDYQNVVPNAQVASLKFLEGSEDPNDPINRGFQFVYDGNPDLLTLERVEDDGSSTILTTWKKDGKIGLGREPIDQILEVNGDAAKSISGNWIANSDRRLKKNISEINDGQALEKVLQMRGVTYKWDDQVTGYERPIDTQVGFIAQELALLFPSKIKEDSNGYLMAAYGSYDAIYVQAFKEQKSQLELLNETSKAIEAKVNNLKLEQVRNLKSEDALKSSIEILEDFINQ